MIIEPFDMTRTTVGDPAMAEDVEAIRTLWKSLGADSSKMIDTETARQMMEGDKYFVARDEETERIIGVQSLWLMGNRLGKLDSIAVDERERRRGVGTALIRMAVEYAFMEGKCKTIMTTALDPSKGILETVGFEVFEETESGAATMFLDKKQYQPV